LEQSVFEERRRALKELVYLPLFYLIPDEIAQKRGLADFPRDPYVAATDEKWREVYFSKHFQVTVMDVWAWMMWQCLGIRGGFDNYSKHDPFVIMAVSLPMWAALLAEGGINTDFLAAMPPGAEIPFLNIEMAIHNCAQIAKAFWNHPKLKMRGVWEIVKTHRDHRDYSGMPSHVKMDFLRKYYHTRAKTEVIALTGEEDEDEEVGGAYYASYIPNEFEEVETRIWFDGFLKRLDEKDRKIVRLLEYGYKQEEIAAMLGYANHSGVTKRIKFIRREFDKFRRE